MDFTILSKGDADEIQSIADNTMYEIEQKDFSADTYLTGITTDLRKEAAVLSNSIGVERSHEFTAELAKFDKLFDDRAICFKSFVDANTHSSDQAIAQNAEKLWKKIAAYDLNFYKLGYEKELTRAFSMIEEFEKPDMLPIIASLVGVATPLAEMKTAAMNLQDLYRKNQGVLATKEEIIPSSVQSKVVLEIMNDKLLPYISAMANAKPAEFGVPFAKIAQYIATINTKIRSRRSKTTTPEEATNEVE
ncbi:DUF6261 family protein [Labilibaculum sp.]|uniref:DUF6261 family protein n=1 Tax=Labilibaculum sp. TaxID=2060723 RepID=UPI002AA86442|nr:DUF6261 family protein [Labilibaculum sp.]